MKNVFWTADDWGMSPGVNAGILELAKLNVVRRVSLMATAPYVSHGLEELAATSAQLGIHFNLTYGSALGQYRWLTNSRGCFHSAKRLLVLWLIPGVRSLLSTEIAQELKCQLDRLKDLGVVVSHLDSHHHTHLLPGLMPKLSRVLQQYEITDVRLPLDSGLRGTPAAAVYWMAYWNRRAFRKLGLHPLPFVYPRSDDFSDPDRLRKKLLSYEIVEAITHPAKRIDFDELGVSDTYRSGRVLEFEVLKGFAESAK